MEKLSTISSSSVNITSPALLATYTATRASELYVQVYLDSLVGGGTPLYTYLWAPGGEITPGLSNVGVGTYDLLVTDGNGCTATDNVVVTSPPAITITTTPINPTCFM